MRSKCLHGVPKLIVYAVFVETFSQLFAFYVTLVVLRRSLVKLACSLVNLKTDDTDPYCDNLSLKSINKSP